MNAPMSLTFLWFMSGAAGALDVVVDDDDVPRVCTDDDVAALRAHLRTTHPLTLVVDAERDIMRAEIGQQALWNDVNVNLDVRGAPLTEPWNIGRTPMGGVGAGLSTKIPSLPLALGVRDALADDAAAQSLLVDERADGVAEAVLAMSVDNEARTARREILLAQSSLLLAFADVARARASVGQKSIAESQLLDAAAAEVRAKMMRLDGERAADAARVNEIVGDGFSMCRVPLTASWADATDGSDNGEARAVAKTYAARADAADRMAGAMAWAFLPEPIVGVGYVFRPDIDGAHDGIDFVGGQISIPIPLSVEKRRAPAHAAHARARRFRAERAVLLREIRAESASLRAIVDALAREDAVLRDEVVPLAAAAAASARTMYETGEGGLTLLLDAERRLLDVEMAAIDIRARKARAGIRRARLLGQMSVVENE